MTDDPGSPEPERLFPECVFTETRLPGGELLLEAFVSRRRAHGR
jgi:hypothetical protein